MLTKRQAETVVWLMDYLTKSGGVGPTFDEIGAGIGLSSKSSVSRLLDCLEERGFIRRLPSRSRAMEVLRDPRVQARPRFLAAGAPSEDRKPDILIPTVGKPPAALMGVYMQGLRII